MRSSPAASRISLPVPRFSESSTKIPGKSRTRGRRYEILESHASISLRDFTQVLQGVTMSPLRSCRKCSFSKSRPLLRSHDLVSQRDWDLRVWEIAFMSMESKPTPPAGSTVAPDQAPREGDPDLHVAEDDLHLPVGDRRVDLRDRDVVAHERSTTTPRRRTPPCSDTPADAATAADDQARLHRAHDQAGAVPTPSEPAGRALPCRPGLQSAGHGARFPPVRTRRGASC